MAHINTLTQSALTKTPWRDPRYGMDYGQREALTEIVAAKRLKTKAKDNHGHQYDVTLVMYNLPSGWVNPGGMTDDEFRNLFCFKWALRIANTPATYYMATLIENPPSTGGMCIDMGQNWIITNFAEVYAEAIKLI